MINGMGQTSSLAIHGTLESQTLQVQMTHTSAATGKARTVATANVIPDPVIKAIASPDYVLQVDMPLHSKARPRMTRSGHAYMAQSYRDAQAEMQKQLRVQWTGGPLAVPVALYLDLYGEARQDIDNVIGFLLDAAGPSKNHPALLWEDDRVSVIPVVAARWTKAKKAESKWIIHIAVL